MLSINNVTKIYSSKSKKEVVALNNVSLSFSNSGLTFILGPSGCGKTTLMNFLGGIDIPTEGRVEYDGQTIGEREEDLDEYRNQHVGFVFQDFNLLDNLTVFDNLALVCFDLSEEEKREKIAFYLEKVGLFGYENRYQNELSGGQIQRVAIARALLKESEILLADEPTGNLNQKLSREIFDLFKEISKEKLVVIVSHNEEFASLYADRIISLRDGEVIADEIINASEQKELPKKQSRSKKINAKTVFKMALWNIKSNKADVIITSIILFLCFACIAVTFSITDYNRLDADIKNLQSMDEIEIFEISRYDEYGQPLNSTPQIDRVLDLVEEVEYIKNGEISSSKDLIDFGLELYGGYNELSEDGIYVYDFLVKKAIEKELLFYDKEGTLPVEKSDVIDYSLLTNVYIHPQIETVASSFVDKSTLLKVDGIVKKLADPNPHQVFENEDEEKRMKYLVGIQNAVSIFYLKGGLFDSLNISMLAYSDHSTEISSYARSNSGTTGVYFGDYGLENFNITFASQLSRFLILTDSELIADKNFSQKDDYFTVSNKNEVYISLSLYNIIFDESSGGDYYLNALGGYNEYEVKNYPRHVGEKISMKIIDNFLPEFKLNFDELILKGIILDSSLSVDRMQGQMLLSNENYGEIFDFNEKPFILVKKDSIKSISKFVKTLNEYSIRPTYLGSRELSDYEFNVISSVSDLFSLLNAALIIVSILLTYNFINRQIKRKMREFGVLKAIGMRNKDVAKIFYLLISIICLSLIVTVIPLSIIATTVINGLAAAEIYSNLTVFFFKWWYAFTFIGFIAGVIFISSFFTISKFKKKKAIELIRGVQ